MSRFIRKNIIEKVKETKQCMYCGFLTRLEIDHIHPVKKGGNGDLSNLTIACYKCNTSKGCFDLETWRFKIEAKRTLIRNKTNNYIYRNKTSKRRKTLTLDQEFWYTKKILEGRELHKYYTSIIHSITYKKYIIKHG